MVMDNRKESLSTNKALITSFKQSSITEYWLADFGSWTSYLSVKFLLVQLVEINYVKESSEELAKQNTYTHKGGENLEPSWSTHIHTQERAREGMRERW